jgi:uncharacterized protein
MSEKPIDPAAASEGNASSGDLETASGEPAAAGETAAPAGEMEAPAPPPRPATPVTGSERIETLDVLRGFAVLGILVMNITAYADIGAVYMNPTARGEPTTIGWIIWTANHLLADFKFMTLFSLLFGAGITLFAARVEARGRKPYTLHYPRMFWLWFLGMIHAYLFWWGDILVSYAVCGSVAFWFRKLRPRTLAIIALILIALPSVMMLGFAAVYDQIPADVREQIEPEMKGEWSPTQEQIDEELATYRGGWLGQMAERAPAVFGAHTGALFFFVGPRVTALMLLGMALFKLGVITGEARSALYRRLMAIGWPLGFALVAAGLVHDHRAGFHWRESMFVGIQFNYWGSLLIAAGYLGMIALWVRGGGWPGLRERLAAVGRMAFTNYLAHTLVFTTVFYGHGLGLFGSVSRLQQAVMVVVMFALQLWLSLVWLRYFRFGPMEWVWRSLTYGKRQPFRRAPVALSGPAPGAS